MYVNYRVNKYFNMELENRFHTSIWNSIQYFLHNQLNLQYVNNTTFLLIMCSPDIIYL